MRSLVPRAAPARRVIRRADVARQHEWRTEPARGTADTRVIASLRAARLCSASSHRRSNAACAARCPSICCPTWSRYIWTARLRSSPSLMAACASSSDSHPRARAARMVAFGDAALTFSSADEHLLTSFPNRFVGIDQPQDGAIALHQRALAFAGKLVQRRERSAPLRRAAGLAFPFHALAANLVDESSMRRYASRRYRHRTELSFPLRTPPDRRRSPEGNSSRGSIAISMSLCWRASPRAHEPNNHTSASCSPSASSTMRRNSSIACLRVGFTAVLVQSDRSC